MPALVDALTHEDPRVREEAAWTLERTVGDLRPAIPGLAKLLRDPEGAVRQAAAHTLRRAGSAVAPIIPEVVEALEFEDDRYRSGVLVDILLRVPDKAAAAVPVLQKARDDGDFLTRIRAALALREIVRRNRHGDEA